MNYQAYCSILCRKIQQKGLNHNRFYKVLYYNICSLICKTVWGDSDKVEYSIIYSDRKTLCMEIKDGKVIVRAPRGCPRSVTEEFVRRHEGWAKEKLQSRHERFIERKLSPEELAELKNLARSIILPRAQATADRLGIKARFGITAARTRFGSCSAADSINFSCFLVLYPQQCIDYVILHELCHTVHRNHSRAFYGLLGSYMPDYRDAQKLLRQL